jgi:P pilus assembly chaperone PapD
MVGTNLEVSATNPANSHVQIIEANMTDEQNKSQGGRSLTPRYILSNQTVTWKLPVAEAPKGKLRIVARTDIPSAAIDALVSLDSPATTP